MTDTPLAAPMEKLPEGLDEPERSRFFGRQREIEGIAALLRSGRRIVTVTGPAGIGKTRLARRVMATTADMWGPGCRWFCECASSPDTSAMIAAAGRALGLTTGSAADVASASGLVGRALAGHRGALLVVDNIEHLLPEAAQVLGRWSDAAPGCAFLVTSRELLRIEGESVFELGPLSEGVDLFLDRARLIRSDYAASEADRRAVSQIVARLDGIPLAVELAAARARVLSPQPLLRQLEAHVETLSRGSRSRDARQSTMREALEWSWGLLEPAEQRAMAVLSLFRCGFCLDDAQRLLRDTLQVTPADVLEVVQNLRDKSLLHSAEPSSADGTTRFGIYEVIRSHARAKLEQEGMTAAACDAHARHFVDRGDRMLSDCPADQLESVLNRLALDREDLESILARGASTCAGAPCTLALSLRAAVLLGAIAGEDGLPPTQAAELDSLLQKPLDGIDEELLQRSRLVRASKWVYAGQPARAEQECRAIVDACRVSGNARSSGHALLTLGAALLRQGHAREAFEALKAAETSCREAGDIAGEQHALCQQGGCAHSLRQGAEALELFQRGLALARTWGLVRGEVRAEAGLGSHFLEAGDYAASREHLVRCGELARAAGFRRTAILVLGHLGILELDHDHLGDALECVTAAAAEAGETGDDVPLGVFLAVEAAVRATMDDVRGAVPLAAHAQRVLARSPLFKLIVEVYSAHIDLAFARDHASKSESSKAAERLSAARRSLAQASSARLGETCFIEQSDDLRVAFRILERAISRADGDLHHAPDRSSWPCPGEGPVLLVGDDAAWFKLGDDRRVDISRRASSRAILRALVQHALSSEPECLSVDDLLAIGWPGEKMARSSALNRLHVALAMLRSLGLRDIIQRRPDGYALAARVKRG